MSKSLITDAKDAIVNVDNQKEGLINVASTIGGLIAGGFISKGVSKVEVLQKYKVWFDTFVLAASAGAQFLPAKYLPSWAKQMSLGLGCYSVLSILGSIANSEKTPEAVKTFLVGYIPTITNGSSLSGVGSVADMWAMEAVSDSTPAISENSSMQAAGSGASANLLNGIDRVAYLGN